MKYIVFVFMLLPTVCWSWSPRVMSAMLDTFWIEYDWQHDYGLNKQIGEFPRLYNLYQGPIATVYYNGEWLRYRAAKALARWDVLIIPFYWMQASNYPMQREMLDSIRAYHPDIKILMYQPVGAVCTDTTHGYLCKLVFDSLNALNCWIKKPDGTIYQRKLWWKVNYYKYPEAVRWMRNFIVQCLNTFPYFDGVLLDLVYSYQLLNNWQNEEDSIDIDENGVDDWDEHSNEWVIKRVQEGLCSLLVAIRDTMGDDFILTGNSGFPWYIRDGIPYDSVYWEALANGNMSEEILDVDGLGQWQIHGPLVAMRAAWQNAEYAYNNPIHFMQEATIDYWGEENDPNGHVWRDRQQMRYTLCICLMTDAYYGYDTGGLSMNSHSEIWWFPEYNCNLGYAISEPQYLHDPFGNPYMRRDFDRGIVLLNATFDTGQTGPTVHIELDTTYWDITTQSHISYVDIPQYDGRILLSKWEGIEENQEIAPYNLELEIYPNPFTQRAVIEFRVQSSESKDLQLQIYDLVGRLVKSFLFHQDRALNNSVTKVVWYGKDENGKLLTSGVYFVRLKVGGFLQTNKLLLLR